MSMSTFQNLHEDETKAIEELRVRMKKSLPSTMPDDNLLFYRFLKARDFDVDKAEEMLRKHIVWRKVFQVDTILENFKYKEVFENFSAPSFLGSDKEGDIVSYFPTGKIFTKELLKCMKMNDNERHQIYTMEKVSRMVAIENEKTGKNSYQGTTIFDLDKLTLANVTHKGSLEFFLIFSHMLQDNYPETLKSAFVINAPSYYVIIYSVLKTMMSNAMLKKIHVFGKNGWKEALLKVIDADVLPAFLGGNRTDADGNPLCPSFVHHGGMIPSKYHLTDEERWFNDPSKIEYLLLSPRQTRTISIEVKVSGSLIQWEFHCNGKDIGFGLFFQDGEKEIEILPLHRFATSDGTEEYFHKAKFAGNYHIIFDNSYSRFSSKEVRYCITVE